MSDHPPDWEIANLSDLATIKASNVDKKTKEGQRDVLLCNYMDVFKNSVISSSLEFMRSTASEREISEFGLSKGDVLLTKDSEVPEEIGIPSVVTEDIPDLVCGYHLYMIRADHSRINPEYLCWTLRSNSSRQYFYQMANGSTRFGLNLKHVEECPIAIPPLPEQKKIAEILSGIDRAIAIYEQQAKVLANMLDALMQEEIVMNTSTKWIKVGDACTAQAGGTPDRSQKGYYEGRIPWVKSGEVRGEDIFRTDESISNEAISNSSAKIVPSGSVLVAMYGATAGQTARLRIDATTNQAVISLNSKTRELSNDYLYHSVTAFKDQLLLTCQGSGQPNLSAGLIKELEIPLPDPLVQQRISSALDSVRQRVLALRSKINSSKSLKSSIASDLLSGRKRVSV